VYIELRKHGPLLENGTATRLARMHHMLVAWSDVGEAGGEITQESERELFVILPDFAADLIVDGATTSARARSVCILPAGKSAIIPRGTGAMIRLFAPVPKWATDAINASTYERPRNDLRPIDPFRRIGQPAPRVYPLADDFGRKPQSFQTESMSVGWFEHDGPQDPSSVFPHAHADFEEGSLMVRGSFVQHLRTPWGADVRAWRADEHLQCEPGTLVIIAPQTTHVAEAVGAGRHVLMNLFAPPRLDHIAKKQILNADEYASP
jgi:hypothetical protein